MHCFVAARILAALYSAHFFQGEAGGSGGLYVFTGLVLIVVPTVAEVPNRCSSITDTRQRVVAIVSPRFRDPIIICAGQYPPAIVIGSRVDGC